MMLGAEPVRLRPADGEAEAAPSDAAWVLAVVDIRPGLVVGLGAQFVTQRTISYDHLSNIGEFEHRLIVLLLFLHYFIAMVETIGEAFSLGWQLKARCAFGNREGTKSVRQCTWTYDLDMLTLVATRGRDFPLAMLASRLRCPRCGSRRVSVVFMPPLEGDRRRGAA
jgi:hypothetical protein